MSEEENVNVIEEVVSPEPEDNQQTERVEESAQSHQRNDQEYNLAQLRRQRDEERRRNQDLQDELQRIRYQAQKEPDEDSLEKLADDDLTTVAHAKKIASRAAKEAAYEALRQRDHETVDERLKSKFSDFDSVVSQENIEFLKQNEPELADSLRALADDPFKQGLTAYKMLKKFIPVKPAPTIEKKKAEANLQKPLSVNAAPKANSALGNAHLFENGLTAELKAQLWKEMQDAKKAG